MNDVLYDSRGQEVMPCFTAAERFGVTFKSGDDNHGMMSRTHEQDDGIVSVDFLTLENANLSPDGTRVVGAGDWNYPTQVCDAKTGDILAFLGQFPDDVKYAAFNTNCSYIITFNNAGEKQLWIWRRPDQWWGVAWLPEWWLTLTLAIALLGSIRRDMKTLCGLPKPLEEKPAGAPDSGCLLSESQRDMQPLSENTQRV